MVKDKILVVDDIELNREILVEILSDDYDVVQAEDGFQAIEIVMNNPDAISLMLLDLMMPDMDGFEVLDVLKSSGFSAKIPVIIITAADGDENEIKGLHAGAADFVGKPFHPEIVKCRVNAQIELKKHRMHLEDLVNINVQKIVYMKESIIDVMASVIEYRHTESGQHVMRTKKMCEILMNHIQNSRRIEEEMRDFNISLAVKAVVLHDIGKISTPDFILLKPGKLTPEEFEIMKEHTVKGAEIIDMMKDLGEPEYLRYCREICLYHHEKWNGGGYPYGLGETEIPLSARVMAIVDVYDALTSERVYKPALDHFEALKIIREGKGEHFDPVIADIFCEKHESFQMD